MTIRRYYWKQFGRREYTTIHLVASPNYTDRARCGAYSYPETRREVAEDYPRPVCRKCQKAAREQGR
jgi:hypothetical protein